MSPTAHPLAVPIQADSVLSPRLTFGHLPLFPDDKDYPPNAIYFPLADDERGLGRVTFEGLDAVRGSRGEHLPYPRAVPLAARAKVRDWVFEVSSSAWLAERHNYENHHYRTPLLDTHQHYLFSFYDHFVEAIAQGVWLDKPDPDKPLVPPSAHPLASFSNAEPAEARRSPSGIRWELRCCRKAQSTLIRDSRLCSQRLYQFNLVLDGESREAASVWLRTSRGHTYSRMTRNWVGELARCDGLAAPDDFLGEWERYVHEVADRRRSMGKPLR
ncbi:hypothetical protein ABH926_008804 [Catenulispora sp. GP43]|uniref:hypothetical protein n=1 Tax=Catenulispora sp. GP43 TaxID=3156263 RepID=UPI003513D628